MNGLYLADSTGAFLDAMARGNNASTGFSLEIYSPFSFLQQLSSEAAKKYMQLTVDSIEEDQKRPVLRVIAHPDQANMVTGAGTAGTSGVAHIVVRSTNDRSPRLVQPVKIVEHQVEAVQNAMGASVAYASKYAEFDMEEVFPVTDADDKGEFFVIVIGVTGEEKRFKVKSKHFSRLP